MWSRKVKFVSVVVAVAILTGLVVVVVHRNHSPDASSNEGLGDILAGTARDNLQLGATLTQQSNLTEALPTDVLNQTVDYVNVSLADDGTKDPEPSPGVYDWSSLDARMRQLAPLHATIVLRAFDAPPWMTQSGQPKTAPEPKYYQAFADLVLAAAKRYPQIHYVVVWNELKGFRSSSTQWNYQGYTSMYNTVYSTLKAYNKNLQIGGPYVPFPPATGSSIKSDLRGPWGALDQSSLNAITYWLHHKIGADFIAIDGRTAESPITPAQPVGSTELFSEVTHWIRSQTSLPIWWMEWYARSPKLGPAEWSAISAYALIQIAESGASNALLWDPEFVPGGASTATPGIWVSGTNADTALTPVFRTLKQDLYKTSVKLYSPAPGVEVLANSRHYVAIELDGTSQKVSITGRSIDLSPYQIATG